MKDDNQISMQDLWLSQLVFDYCINSYDKIHWTYFRCLLYGEQQVFLRNEAMEDEYRIRFITKCPGFFNTLRF